MNVLERADEGIANEQSRLEQELEQQKREWELDRKRAIANNEEMMNKSRQEDEEDHLTVSREQVNQSSSDEDSDSSSNSDSDNSESDDENASQNGDKLDIAERIPRTRSRGHVNIDLWTLDDKEKGVGRRQGVEPPTGEQESSEDDEKSKSNSKIKNVASSSENYESSTGMTCQDSNSGGHSQKNMNSIDSADQNQTNYEKDNPSDNPVNGSDTVNGNGAEINDCVTVDSVGCDQTHHNDHGLEKAKQLIDKEDCESTNQKDVMSSILEEEMVSDTNFEEKSSLQSIGNQNKKNLVEETDILVGNKSDNSITEKSDTVGANKGSDSLFANESNIPCNEEPTDDSISSSQNNCYNKNTLYNMNDVKTRSDKDSFVTLSESPVEPRCSTDNFVPEDIHTDTISNEKCNMNMNDMNEKIVETSSNESKSLVGEGTCKSDPLAEKLAALHNGEDVVH